MQLQSQDPYPKRAAFYCVGSASAPSAAQIKAGQDQTGASAQVRASSAVTAEQAFSLLLTDDFPPGGTTRIWCSAESSSGVGGLTSVAPAAGLPISVPACGSTFSNIGATTGRSDHCQASQGLLLPPLTLVAVSSAVQEYPADVQCTWTVGPGAYELFLTQLSLENSGWPEEGDTLTIWDGMDSCGELLVDRAFALPPTKKLLGNSGYFYIEFHSDTSVAGGGLPALRDRGGQHAHLGAGAS